MENEFMLKIIAYLNKQLTKKSINGDLRTLDNTMYVRVLAKLSKTLARKQLNKQLKELNDLYVKVGANVSIDKNTKGQLQKNIMMLQESIADLEIGLKTSKYQQDKINTEIKSIRNRIQQDAENNPISFNLQVKKEKLLSDIEYLGKRYSKLFSNVSATQKYEKIMSNAFNVSDKWQLADTRAELSAFTSELKANGLAAQSTTDKWKSLVDRSKDLFSAATLVRVIFSQLRESVSTFLQLDTAMTGVWKVSNNIASREQFSGLLTKWNKLAQDLSVTTTSLINSVEEWSKIGFDLDMSEQLAELTTIFEKTAEISNDLANKTLVSTAQAFTEIDGFGEEDYVKRVEAIGNKINAVGNKYAISSEGISEALQNSSAALVMANNDLNESIAMITVGNKIFQSPEEMGNTLKVVSARLRGQKGELEALNEDTEGMIEGVSKVQTQILNLTGNKVNIFESDNETLKSTYDILLEVGKVYDSLSDKDQASLTEIMFGKQRMSAGSSILLNYEELEQVKNDSINAADSMAEEYAKYMESAEASITTFKEKLIETYSTFMSGSMIKFAANTGSAFLDLANSTDLLRHSLLAVATINIGKGISTVGAVVASTVKQMNTLGSALEKVKNLPLDDVLRDNALLKLGEATQSLTEKNLKLLLSQKQLTNDDKIAILVKHNLTEEEAKAKLAKMQLTSATNSQSKANVQEAATTWTLSGAMTSLKTTIHGVGVALKASFLNNPIGWVLTGITTAVSIASTAVDGYNQKLEEQREEIKQTAEESANHAQSLLDLRKQLEEGTASAEDLTIAFREQMRAMGYTETEIDTLIDKYGNLADAIDEATREALENAKTDAYADVSISGKSLVADAKGNTNVGTYYSQNKELSEEIQRMLEGSTAVLDGGVFRMDKDASAEDIYEYYLVLKDISQLIQETASETGNDSLLSGNSLNPTPYYQVSEALDALSESAKLYGDAIDRLHSADARLELSDYLKTNDIDSKEAFDTYVDGIKNSKEYSEAYKQVLLEVANDAFPQFSAAAKDASDSMSDFGNEIDVFKSFDGSNFGNRIQHVTDLFNEGEISHKQYFDALQNELENVDFTKLTDSLEDANEAAQQFFTDSVQQTASGLSSLINSFDTDEISVSEYLDGYLSIADTINTLTDDLQENSAEWNKNGEAISDSTNTALDQAQSDLQNAMNAITEFQDSTYALEQIMSGSVERTSDGFHAYTNLIAADLAGIVAAGGEMADEISSYMGTTTEEIANALLEDTSNFSIAEQAIAQNTNVAIQNMADSISTLIDNLGKAISDFKVDISFGLSEDSGSLWDAITGNGELKFELGASGESLSAIGNAISSFGSSISTNLAQQFIQSEDYHRGTEIEGSNYKPNGSVLKSYEDELDRVKDTSSSAKKEFNETVDWFKERIEELDNAFSLLDTNLNNIVGSFAKNKLVDAQIGLSSEKVNNYTDALAMYTQKANEALSKLPADIAEKVKNGSVSIVDFVGSGNEAVVDAIKEYDKWADEISSCQNELAELQQTIEDLELSKFENIAEDFSNMFDLRENGKNLIDQTKEWIESSGQLVGSAFFDAEIDQSSKQLALLEEEKAQLVNQMTSALSSGYVSVGSEAWLSMLDTISEVESNILNTKTSIEEFNTAIQNLHWENIDRISDRFSDISEEINNLIGLIDDVDVSDKNGNWSKEGLVQIGLYAQEYERAVYASQMYAEEIEKLNQAYTNGEYSLLEYQERLASLTEEQWNNINASEEALDSIKQLNEQRVDIQIEGINKEIEKYEELINAQIESLRAEKELNDYKKSIANKTDEAEKLQREIIAMQNDTSASTTALRLQKEAELADKLAELQELEYEHSIESQEGALNKQFEDYEKTRNAEIDALKESLNDQETLIAQSFETVKQNATLIGQQISNIAKQHGVTVSNSLISSWQSGENAIASYGTVLSAQSSAFIGNIMGVENEVWNLQAQANNTANSLAWMFSTQADNLVNELAQSYYAEGNLMNMTNALQSSLVNTLERGYNISGITSALGSITSNLNSVTSAANSAASALQNMYNQQERVNYAPTPTEIVEITKPDTSLNNYMNETLESRNQPTSNSLFNSVLNDRSGSEFLKNRLNKYASGTRNAKGGLRIEGEEDFELVLPKLSNGYYAIGNDGDQILTKAQTDNIFDWSKFNPDMFVPQFARNIVTNVPEIVPKNVNNAPSLHLDKLIHIDKVDNSNIKQMESIANKAVNNLVDKLYNGKKYGSY